MKRIVAFFCFLICMTCATVVHANVASRGYVDQIVNALAEKQSDWAQTDSTQPDYIKNKPDIYTKAEVDALVANQVDAYTKTEVDNLLNNKADTTDVRFTTIPTTAPSGTPPSGQVFIWFN